MEDFRVELGQHKAVLIHYLHTTKAMAVAYSQDCHKVTNRTGAEP